MTEQVQRREQPQARFWQEKKRYAGLFKNMKALQTLRSPKALLQRFRLDYNKALTFGLWGAGGAALSSLLSEQFANHGRSTSLAQSVFEVGLWFGIIGAFIALAILAAQSFYLKRGFRDLKPLLVGAGLGLIAGAVAGSIAQLVYGIGGQGEFLRIICWGIAGGLLGIVLSLRIPNLGRLRGLQGGALGGVIGGCLFILFAWIFGGAVGRLIGTAAIGFFIGLMIVIAETAFREAWLEIHYNAHEIRNVSLGPEPVSIGSDANACTIYLRKAPPVACRFKLQDGRIHCQDAISGAEETLQPGEQKQIGDVRVLVRAAGAFTIAKTLPPATDGKFSLHLPDRRISLSLATRLTAHEIPGLEAQSSNDVVAEVNSNPNDPGMMGLQNCSRRSWEVLLTDGTRRTIESGRSIKLAAGTKIDFGVVQGEIT